MAGARCLAVALLFALVLPASGTRLLRGAAEASPQTVYDNASGTVDADPLVEGMAPQRPQTLRNLGVGESADQDVALPQETATATDPRSMSEVADQAAARGGARRDARRSQQRQVAALAAQMYPLILRNLAKDLPRLPPIKQLYAGLHDHKLVVSSLSEALCEGKVEGVAALCASYRKKASSYAYALSR
eukprot:scaffold1210_cov410-Prasinococcus_capsulatus_cf.AAC.18